MKIDFENGSIVEGVENNQDTTRGKRSKVIIRHCWRCGEQMKPDDKDVCGDCYYSLYEEF